MPIRHTVRRLLLGPYAVIWMAILTQLVWQYYSGSFLDHWYCSCASSLALYIALRRDPNQDIVEVGATAIPALILSIAV